MILRHTITEREDGLELATVLRRTLRLSASAVKRLRQTDSIELDGRYVYTNVTVSKGQLYTINLAESPCDIVPEEGEIHIIYEDEWLIAVSKPAGMLVHPSRSRYTGTLSNYVFGYLKAQGVQACHSVNRLDRDTSGAVLFSKSAHAKNLCIPALREPSSRKEYIAVVCGSPENTEGEIDAPIRRIKDRDMLRIVAPDGDRAVTEYKVLATGNFQGERLSVVQFRLLTGRTHQIRVHCLHMGFPILGDVLYYTGLSRRSSQTLKADAQMLHSRRLVLSHPDGRGQLEINAPILRQDMKEIVQCICVNC